MRYLLGSSFFDGGKNGAAFRRQLAVIWAENVARARPQPSRVVIVSEGGSKRPNVGPLNADIVRLTGDCGHCDQLVKGERANEFSGWSASMTALAMLAYTDMADFLYWEEDCLAFGDVVGQLYRDMGDGDMVFGRKMTSAPWMPAAQSLFLVRHSFIPTFVHTYLSMGGERKPNNLGEHKFVFIESRFGSRRIRRLSFGVDRERPLPWDAPVWYAQQWTSAELEEAARRKLINGCPF